MPSALDLRLDAAYNLITGPGGPIQVGSVERFGRQLPFITNAPTNLADYVAFFAAQHGDATFLVEGDERLSFKQVYMAARQRSEEHTSELQSLMRISYAVFCLKKKKTTHNT